MAFDEYEYLEKSVEDPEYLKKKESSEKRERVNRKREDNGDVDDEDERKSKRSRSAVENGDRRREEREKRRDKDERHKSDRDEERSRESRDRENRDRDKERERKERKEREREGEKARDRDERDRERERSGSSRSRRHDSLERERERRSSSRSRRHDSRERSSSRSRRHDSKEREFREREREFESRDSRRFKDKKEAVEPEADPERDQRTVFAYQMPLKATERDVYEFFSKAGKVRDVRLIMDRNSRRSKGVGYIEFYDAMSVPMAIALTGQLLLGQPVMVKPSEAEKNLVQSTSGGSSVTGPYGPTDRKLYVGNLHFSTTEHQLRQIFEPFGPVELVQLPLDLETGQCKGFGFVQFAQVEHAKAAQTLNGQLEIAGRYIKVSSVTDHVAAQDTSTNTADFDDDDGGGLALSSQSRAILMQKLDRTGTASSIIGSLGAPAHNGSVPVQQPIALPTNSLGVAPLQPAVLTVPAHEPIGIPSECLLLKNLFDPATEAEPDFDLDIKEDVHDECSKYGQVRHIYVDRNSAGHVYLRFDSKEAAVNAQRGMHMRWFARRLISAIFLQPYEYEAKFRDGS